MGPFKFGLVAAVLLALSHGTLAQLHIRGNGGLFGGESGGDLSSGDQNAGYPGETNGYLPPVGSPSNDNRVTAYPPSYTGGETNLGPEVLPPVQPQLGCAAALICVEEQFCSMTGIILDAPISLTEEQKLRRVPMVDCRNPDNGVVGKCCRDPNYVDPWPAGNLPANYSGGFDDQGFPKFLNLSKNKNNKKPIVPQKTFQNQPSPFQNQPTGFTNQPVQPQFMNQLPTNNFGSLQPQPSSHVTIPAGQGVISHPSISPVGKVTPVQPMGTPVGTINKSPAQPVGVTMSHKNPFLQPTQRPIVVAEQPQKTFPGFSNLPSLPSLPSFDQIPNVIAGLNPFNPPTDSQIVEAPQDVPNVPLADSTTKKPGFFPNFPNFPNFGFGGKVTENAPDAQAPVIAPHTPGAQCGIINKVQHAGGLDDVEVAFGEIPWQAMILSNAEKKLLCSGAIVAPNRILTAAHCVYGHQPSEVSVKAGEWKLGYELKHEEPLPFEIVQVKNIEVHPNYQPGAAGFDIAVLFLQNSFKLDLHVDTICADQTPVINPQRQCISTGWGKVVLQSHAAGSLMHKIDVDVIGNDQCRQRLQGAESALDIDDSLVCVKAHRQNNNMCQVDVGGPLACDRGDGNYEIVGVYSQDTGCLPTNQVATFALVDNWVTGMISNGEPLAPQATAEHDDNPTPIVGQSQPTFQQQPFQQSRPNGQVSTTFQQGRGPTVGHIQTTYQPGPSSVGDQVHPTFPQGSTPGVGQTQITFQQAPNPVVGQTQTTFQHGPSSDVGQAPTTFQHGPSSGVGQAPTTFQHGPSSGVGQAPTTFQHGPSSGVGQAPTPFQHESTPVVGQTTFQQNSRPTPIAGQTPTGFHHKVAGPVTGQAPIQQSRPSPIAGQSQIDVQQINKIHYHPNQPDVPCDCQQGTQPAGLNQYLPPV